MKALALCLFFTVASTATFAQATPQAARTPASSTADAPVLRSVPQAVNARPMNNAELSKLLRAQTLAIQSLSAKLDALAGDVADSNARAKARLVALTQELAGVDARARKP